MLGWILLAVGVLMAVAIGRWAERSRRSAAAGAWSDLAWPASATADPEAPAVSLQDAVATPEPDVRPRDAPGRGDRARRGSTRPQRPALRPRMHRGLTG